MLGEEDAQASVERALATELARLDALLVLAMKLLTANATIGVGPSGITRKTAGVLLGLYAKAIKTARGVRLLASASLAEDGMVLCRTLLETTVAIFHITRRDTTRRVDEYLAHVLMRTQMVMERWAETPGLKRHGRGLMKKVQRHLPPYSYLGESRLKQLRGWYSGEKLEQTFKNCGLNKAYQVSYRYLTGFQHVSDLSSHVEFTDDGGLALRSGSSDLGQMRMLLFLTHQFLWAAMHQVSRKVGLGYEAEIESHRPPATGPGRCFTRGRSGRRKKRLLPPRSACDRFLERRADQVTAGSLAPTFPRKNPIVTR